MKQSASDLDKEAFLRHCWAIQAPYVNVKDAYERAFQTPPTYLEYEEFCEECEDEFNGLFTQ